MRRRKSESGESAQINAEAKMALKSVSIKGSVIDKFADITIKQSYLNDISKNIEAIYTFPLPDNASVYSFTAVSAGREIAGTVMKREKAVEQYGKAILEGDGAALFESHRPNIFQISLGQIGAGEQVDIQIGYIAELKVSGGEMRLLTPMVVAPRYIPSDGGELTKTGPGAKASNERVPDAGMITPPAGITGYRAEAEITFDIGCGAESINSPSHKIKTVEDDFGWIKVTFADDAVKMDRDFIINAQFPKTRPERFLCGKAKTGEYFSYISVKPELPEADDEMARDYNFLIDVSGSMDGIKLDEAKTALKICLRNLSEKDFFNIIAFESYTHQFMQASAAYNQVSLEAATRWVDALRPMGGTEILKPIQSVLADKSRGAEKIVILITDGEVGNEKEIISFVKKNGANSRFFTVGIDTAVNSYFINSLAEATGGAAEFVYPGEAVDDKILRHFARIGCARLENISVTAAGAGGFELAGKTPEIIFSGDEFSALARMASEPSGAAAIKGTINGKPYEYEARQAETSPEYGDTLARLWAMTRINQLEEYEPECNEARRPSVIGNIIEISEKYGVISKHTAFFARITRENKLSGMPETVIVAVEMPAGWNMKDSGASIQNNYMMMGPAAAVCYSPMPSGGRKSNISMKSNIINNCMRDEDDLEINNCIDNDDEVSYNKPEQILSAPLIKKDMCYSPIKDNIRFSSKLPDDELKILSLRQNADGSFGRPDLPAAELLKETAEAVIKFIAAGSGAGPYRKILNKAVKFLLSKADIAASPAGQSTITAEIKDLIRNAIEKSIKSNILNSANISAAAEYISRADA